MTASDFLLHNELTIRPEATFVAAWDDGPDDAHPAWARTSFAAMQPFASRGLYVNFIFGQEEEAVQESYRANYARLAALKQKYDPANFFRLNQNIKPDLKMS